jgi:septation ring formation regulator EzrA
MKKHFQYQSILMNKALRLQTTIQIHTELESEYEKKNMPSIAASARIRRKKCEEQYAETMTQLANHLCNIAGVRVSVSRKEEQINMVSLAENILGY